ncbi:MAG: hypothetical protein LBL58_12435 [Tannerellaceae bacterium]|jgi:hypothetical protein|nr:hypothetical protein [Tannerellaceae bacterium]
MSKIICNSIEFIFTHEIRVMVPGKVTLMPGGEWKILKVTEKPVYRSETSRADPGPVKEETATAVTRYSPDAILKQYSNFPVVLRLKTDDAVFFVGSQQYPVLTEVSCDMVNDNYSFSCRSEP